MPTYINAHTWETVSSLPNDYTLLLTADGVEFVPETHEKSTVYVYFSDQIASAEHDMGDASPAVNALKKFLEENWMGKNSKLAKLFNIKNQELNGYNSKFSELNPKLGDILHKLKETKIARPLVQKSPTKYKNLLECFHKGESDFRTLFAQTGTILKQCRDLILEKYTKFLSLREKLLKNDCTTLSELLSIYQQLVQLNQDISSEKLRKDSELVKRSIELVTCAHDLPASYKSCVEEITRRRQFLAKFEKELDHINTRLAMERNIEISDRMDFFSRSFISSLPWPTTENTLRDILISKLFPFLDDRELPEFKLDLTMSSTGPHWLKKMGQETSNLPSSDDLIDLTFSLIGSTMDASVSPANSTSSSSDVKSALSDALQVDIEDDDFGDDQPQEKEIAGYLKSTMSLNKGNLGSSSASNIAMQQQIRSLEQELEQLRSENARLTDSLKTTKQELKDQEAEHQAEQKALRATLQQVTANYNKKLNEAHTSIESLQQALALEKTHKVQETNNEKLKEMERDHHAMLTAIEQKSSTRISELENLVAHYTRDIEELKIIRKQLENANRETEAQLEVSKSEAGKLRAENARLKSSKVNIEVHQIEIAKLQSEVDHLTKQLKSAQQSLHEVFEQSTSLQKLIANANEAKQKAETALQQSQQQVNELHLGLAEKDKALNQVRQEVQQMNAQVQQKEQDCKEKDAIIASLQGQSIMRPNDIKVTLFNFQPDDIVLFRNKAPNTWEVFNQDCPNFYLSGEAVKYLKAKLGNKYDQLQFIRAKILYMDEFTADRSTNPFNLPLATKFNVVHIYPFDETQ